MPLTAITRITPGRGRTFPRGYPCESSSVPDPVRVLGRRGVVNIERSTLAEVSAGSSAPAGLRSAFCAGLARPTAGDG